MCGSVVLCLSRLPSRRLFSRRAMNRSVDHWTSAHRASLASVVRGVCRVWSATVVPVVLPHSMLCAVCLCGCVLTR